MTLTVQFTTILTMIAGGIYLGAAIDTFRRFETVWKRRVFFSYAVEIGFWLLQTLVLFYLLFRMNQGELRLYILLALICGFSMYKALLEVIYKRGLELLIGLIISISRFFYRLGQLMIVRPVIALVRLLMYLAIGIWTCIVWIVWTILRVLFYPFKLIARMIWYLIPANIKKYLHNLAGFYSRIKNTVIKWVRMIMKKRR
ncbi:spore cortex biosynthesis protein YabQ [Sediminibacillus massiliensis]|uniref:spore cortex biosynthesis protein YabQ n=1 Tax=Sediminibacillus massiliensis TaxID=1926277 RepID=UPI0009884F67|nr:spore cortex biosynthesis protein YabQ [Sediminibacillus massiliensis]